MSRKRLLKFRLTRKQKRKLVTVIVLALLAAGGLWLYHYPLRFTQGKRIVPLRGAPKIAFCIDDIGFHDKYKRQLVALGSNVTYAILPLLPYSRYFGHLSEKTHADVILHLPLDTTTDVTPGPGLIVSTMSDADIRELIGRDLDSVPNYVGVNNHCGSRGTADPRLMTVILTELKRRRLFFLDSYTTRDSVVPEVARQVKIPFLQRGVFLDNSDSKESIRIEIGRLEKVAREKGSAIAIGHYRKNTLEVLAKEIPRLKSQGFQIISLKQLLRNQGN